MIIAVGCVPSQEVDIEFPFAEKMVLYGFWSLDRPHELFVGNSLAVNQSGELIALEGASVLLSVNGERVDSLSFADGRYVSSSSYRLEAEVPITLEVDHPDYPSARVSLSIPESPVTPTRIVSVETDSADEVVFSLLPWVADNRFNLGYYSLLEDGRYAEIDEPLDSLFPSFNYRSPFQLGEPTAATFTLGRFIELVPPFVPEFMLVELTGYTFGAYRYSPELIEYIELQTAANDAPLGSAEINLVRLGELGNVEGGYGIVTYYQEIRQKLLLE